MNWCNSPIRLALGVSNDRFCQVDLWSMDSGSAARSTGNSESWSSGLSCGYINTDDNVMLSAALKSMYLLQALILAFIRRQALPPIACKVLFQTLAASRTS